MLDGDVVPVLVGETFQQGVFASTGILVVLVFLIYIVMAVSGNVFPVPLQGTPSDIEVSDDDGYSRRRGYFVQIGYAVFGKTVTNSQNLDRIAFYPSLCTYDR